MAANVDEKLTGVMCGIGKDGGGVRRLLTSADLERLCPPEDGEIGRESADTRVAGDEPLGGVNVDIAGPVRSEMSRGGLEDCSFSLWAR